MPRTYFRDALGRFAKAPGFTFVPNKTVAAQILVDPGVGRAVMEVGEEVLAEAQRLVPVDTGDLQRSLRLDAIENNGARVSANEPYWNFPEYGTSNPNYPVQPYLRPALTACGLSVT